MVKVCECCGHPMPDLEAAEYLTKQQTLILIALKKAGQAGLTLSQLASSLHAHNPNGGPKFAEQSLRVQLSKMQHVLKPFGLRVRTARNSVRSLQAI